MRTLVQAVRASSLPPLTAADVLSLGAAPRDALQAFLVAHAPCTLAGPDAVVLDPLAWRQGALVRHGRCRRCGAKTIVDVEAIADTALHWWLVVAVALVRDHRDVFTATDGTVTPAYLRCLGQLEHAVRLTVLLEQAAHADIVH